MFKEYIFAIKRIILALCVIFFFASQLVSVSHAHEEEHDHAPHEGCQVCILAVKSDESDDDVLPDENLSSDLDSSDTYDLLLNYDPVKVLKVLDYRSQFRKRYEAEKRSVQHDKNTPVGLRAPPL